MDLRQLRYFKEVVEVGSFLGASEQLDTAQPSVWRQVKALEKELGVTLFERSGRRVKATSAGLVLLPLAEQVLASADKMKALATELMHGRAGIVTDFRVFRRSIGSSMATPTSSRPCRPRTTGSTASNWARPASSS